MDEELREQLVQDIVDVLDKYDEHLAAAIVGIACFDENDELTGRGHAFLPVDPRDHEEEILRIETARKVFKLTEELARNTYSGG